MAEQRLRLAAVSVVGGALDGRRHDIVDVVGEILIGSDPDCQLCVDLPSISPVHARIVTDLGQASVRETSAPRGIYLNSVRVEREAVIAQGDTLWLGPPGEPESVSISFTFEPWREVLPAVAAASEPVSGPGADAPDPFFIATEAGAQTVRATTTAPPAAKAPVAPPAEPSLFPGVPDEAWTIGEPPPEPPRAAPGPLPALQTQAPVAPAPAAADDFFIAATFVDEAAPAAAPQAAPAIEQGPVPAIEPLSTTPPALATHPPAPRPPAAAPLVPGGVPGGPKPPAPAARRPAPAGAQPAARPAAQPTAARPVVPPAARAAVPAAGRPAPPAGQRPETDPVPPATRPAPVAARPAAPRPAASPAPRPASPAPRPRPATPAARPATPARGGRAPQAVARRAGGGRRWVKAAAIGVSVAVIAGGFVGGRKLGEVRLERIDPARVRVGQRAVLQGRGFATDPEKILVLVEGMKAKVLTASARRLEVEVPAVVTEGGSERRVGVVVQRGRRSSKPLTISVLQGPRLHALSVAAALPGEEVVLTGSGLGLGASVRFGSVAAEVREASATQLRVVVPELAVGSVAPAVVGIGGVESNTAPFVVGHLPVVTGIEPTRALPGDVVRIAGLGFQPDPALNRVLIGGRLALVVSAAETGLEVVVPRVDAGAPARPIEIHVADNSDVGTTVLDVPAPADPIELRFVAEPFTAVEGRPHAVVSTGLGPAFVFAAAGGRTAAQRAQLAAARLNQSLEALRTTLGLNYEARGWGASPAIALAGRPDVLIQVAEEDAQAYGEDWTRLRGKGGPVTPDRLARWWEAVARDLVLLLLRGEPPRFAAQLAPEGRVLVQLHDAARKTSGTGVPRSLVEQAKPPLREGLRLIALRVPASVTPPPAARRAPGASATPTPAALPPLEGTLRGSQRIGDEQAYLTVSFTKDGGEISYEGGITLTMPFLTFEKPARDRVRFSVQMGGGWRYYNARWDGQKLVGTISSGSSDGVEGQVEGSFELHR